MGCYADIYAGKNKILTYKNALPNFLLDIFNSYDKICEYGEKASKIIFENILEKMNDFHAKRSNLKQEINLIFRDAEQQYMEDLAKTKE